MDDDVDIYGDLPSFNANECSKCKETSKELNEKNTKLEAEGSVWKKKCEAFEEEKKTILTNTSSLMKTARAEIARKDKIISELRRELEDLKFKRGVWSGATTKRPEPQDLRKLLAAKQNIKALPRKIISTVPLNGERVGKTFLAHDEEDPEQKWEPRKQTVTLYGERLRRKIRSEEEAERVRREKARAPVSIAPPTSSDGPGALADAKNETEDIPAARRRVANDKPAPAYSSEEEEGELVEEKCEQRDGPVWDKSVENKITSVRDPERIGKKVASGNVEEGRNGLVGYVAKSQYRPDDLYESLSEDDCEDWRIVDDLRDDKLPNFHRERHRKADFEDHNGNSNRDLLYAPTTEARYDRPRRSRDSGAHSDHDRNSHRHRKSERSRLAHEQRSKSSYRSHSKTPERRSTDDKKRNKHRVKKHNGHGEKYEKRNEDVLEGCNSKDRCNKDNYDFRDWHEVKIDDKSGDRGGSDNYRNYDSDHRSGGESHSPGKKSRSKSKTAGVVNERRGIKRSGSRRHRLRSEKEAYLDTKRHAKKPRSNHCKIDADERDDVEKPRKSESSGENSAEETARKKTKRTRTKTTSNHETHHDLINGDDVATETLQNLLDQVEARDKCILMLENEEVPLSPLVRPKTQPAGSHSFREEKIENIEKFIQDYQYDEAHWSVLGNDATSEQNDDNNPANSTSGIVDTLSMDMDDIVVDKESPSKIAENSKYPVDIKNSVVGHESKKDFACHELEGSAVDAKTYETIDAGNGNVPSTEKTENAYADGESGDRSTRENLEHIAGDKKSKNLAAEENSNHIANDLKLDGAVANDKFAKRSARKKSEDVTACVKHEDAVADKKNDEYDKRKKEVPIDKKKKGASIDKRKEVVVDKKMEKVPTVTKKEEVLIDKKIEEVTIIKKVQEVANKKNTEEATILEKVQEVAIKKKTEEVAIGKKNEVVPSDKKKETVATHKKQEETVCRQKAENESIEEALEGAVTGKNLGEVEVSNLGDQSTDTESSRSVVGCVNSKNTTSNPSASSEDICLDEEPKETMTEMISTNIAVDRKREDDSARKKSRDAAIIDQRPDNTQVNEESENSVIDRRSDNATIDKKLQNVDATMTLSDATINHKQEIVSSDRQSDNLARVEKPEESVLANTSENPATDDTRHRPIDETRGASCTNGATSIPSIDETLQTPEFVEDPERRNHEILPPLPPSPTLSPLPPLPPSPPPEEPDISIFPKSQHIKQDTEKSQVDKAVSKQTKDRPRIPCLPIVSLYSRKRRGLVLTDSASSHTVVKSAKESSPTESPREKSKSPKNSRLEQQLVLSLVKIKHTSKSSKIQSESPTNGSTVVESVTETVTTNSVETWNIRQSKCVFANNLEDAPFDSSKPEVSSGTGSKTCCDDESPEDELLPDSLAGEKNVLVEREVKDIEKKSEETRPEVEPKVDSQSINAQRTSTRGNSSSSKSSERGKRLALKAIASTVPSNDSSNRKRPLSREKENQTKIGKPLQVMVIRRRRPVQLEDSSTVTTLVSSEHEEINKDDDRISRIRDGPGRKRRVVET